MRNTLELGKWNVICQRCGLQFKNDALRSEWTGLKVCKDCWEPRHPQTLIRAPRAESPPAWTSPEPPDTFIQLPSYFSFSPTAPERGQTVTFTDASPDHPTTWAWNFGDASTSTSQNPTHAYTSAGTFSVSLSTDVTTSTSHNITVSLPTLAWNTAASLPVGGFSFSSSNRVATTTSTSNAKGVYANVKINGIGKVYWECAHSGDGGNFDAATPFVGIYQPQGTNPINSMAPSSYYWGVVGNGKIYNQTSGGATTGLITNSTLMFAFDGATNKWWVGRNGSWLNGGDPAAGTGQAGTTNSGVDLYPCFQISSGWHVTNGTIKGQNTCSYSPPSGFGYLGL